MRLLVLLSCTGLARALVPACIAELGSEFCPSSQVMSYDDEPLYDQFRKENPAVFPSFMTQVHMIDPLSGLVVAGSNSNPKKTSCLHNPLCASRNIVLDIVAVYPFPSALKYLFTPPRMTSMPALQVCFTALENH